MDNISRKINQKTSKAQQNDSKSTKISENGEKFDMTDHKRTKFCQNGKNSLEIDKNPLKWRRW